MMRPEDEYQPLPLGPFGRVFRALGLLLMLGGVVWAIFAMHSLYEYKFAPQDLTLSEVEEHMDVNVPDGTELVGAADVSTFWSEAVAHLRMSKSNLQTFKEQFGVDFSADPELRRNAITAMRFDKLHQEEWWASPDIADDFLCALRVQKCEESCLSGRRHLYVLVKIHVDSHADVYLYWTTG